MSIKKLVKLTKNNRLSANKRVVMSGKKEDQGKGLRGTNLGIK